MLRTVQEAAQPSEMLAEGAPSEEFDAQAPEAEIPNEGAPTSAEVQDEGAVVGELAEEQLPVEEPMLEAAPAAADEEPRAEAEEFLGEGTINAIDSRS